MKVTRKQRKPRFYIGTSIIIATIALALGFWVSFVLMADNDMVITRLGIFGLSGLPITLVIEEFDRYFKWRKTTKEVGNV